MIDILLATYNGEAFLAEQIDSLLRQTCQDWSLIIGDDGSTDNTAELLRGYISRYPDRMRLLQGGGGLGAAGNFARLIAASNAPYIMLCDQDDVWHEDKIALSLEALQALEALHGKHTPLLVHTDAALTDEHLRVTHPSFAAARKSYSTVTPFGRLLVQNPVHGCAMIFNRALAVQAAPLPAEARMHDMWLALIASAFGHIAYIPRATLDYRQHGRNVIGMRKLRLSSAREDARRIMALNLRQAHAFHARYGGQLPASQRVTLEAFLTLPHKSWLSRRINLLHHGLLRRPLWQNIAVLLSI